MIDEELETSEVARIGDVLANREEYHEADEWIGSVVNQLELSRSYAVREFLHLMGRELAEIAHEDGILTSAFKATDPGVLSRYSKFGAVGRFRAGEIREKDQRQL